MAHIQSTPGTMTRRTFLKAAGALGVQLAIMPWASGLLPATAAEASDSDRLIPIPPSLMLHSADGRADFLPPLLETLNQHSFRGTTYQEWRQRLRQNRPLSNPVIISIDDISLAQQGCPAFAVFSQMKTWLKEAGMTAVYGVITEPVINGQPQRTQDEARWDMMQAWVEEGFELASHTSYHSNFNALDSGPRADFTAVDYEAEIVRSAALIEAKLGERGLDYRVQTLITPYGSGYSYKQPDSAIHPGIVAACGQTNIRFVVGIAQGRAPLPWADLAGDEPVVYTGRIPPAYMAEGDEPARPAAGWTWSWLQAWREYNQTFEVNQEPVEDLRIGRPLPF
jgi:peptidoglycan/xylan/chitin deacetylase (PgdA/CDA1 family)